VSRLVPPRPGILRAVAATIPDTLMLDRTAHVAGRVIGKVTYPGLRHLLDQAAGGPT
jgi:hypothetical protein